jgi:hypothetical protein
MWKRWSIPIMIADFGVWGNCGSRAGNVGKPRKGR